MVVVACVILWTSEGQRNGKGILRPDASEPGRTWWDNTENYWNLVQKNEQIHNN